MTNSATTTSRKLLLQIFVCALALSTAAGRARGQDSTVRNSSAVASVHPVTNGSKVLEKGTLANAKLIQDTKAGVAGKVASMGCTNLGDVDTYVLTNPVGPLGAREWKERWVVAGCGSHYPVDIEFKEDGHGGADWTIR